MTILFNQLFAICCFDYIISKFTSLYFHLIANTAHISRYGVWNTSWQTQSSETRLNSNHWELQKSKKEEDSWSYSDTIKPFALTSSTKRYCSASAIILTYFDRVKGEFFICFAIYILNSIHWAIPNQSKLFHWIQRIPYSLIDNYMIKLWYHTKTFLR